MGEHPPVLRRTAGYAAPWDALVFLPFGHTNGTKVPHATPAKPINNSKGKKKKKDNWLLIGLLPESLTSLLLTWSTKTSIILSVLGSQIEKVNTGAEALLLGESTSHSYNSQFCLTKILPACKKPATGRGATEYPNVALKPLKDGSKDRLLWLKKSGREAKQAQFP